MNDLGWTAYLAIFAGATGLSLAATPVALRLAVRLGAVDVPGRHKSHASPVPYLGGAAIAVAFSAAVVVAAAVRPPDDGFAQLVAIVGLALALSLVGLADDLRGLDVWVRFGAQIAAAGLLWAAGVGVQLVDVAAVDALITVVWVVGVSNAFNLLDNMDGLSAGVAAIAAMWFFAIAALNGQFLVAALALALAGCALGFLKHNLHPARIYMGDAGSLFLGFLLAAIGIKLRFDAPVSVTFLVPVLVLAVAVFDTALVVATRLLHRRNPLAGGRDHVSHRLVFVGIPVPVAVALIHGAAVAHGWLAVVMSRLDPTTAYVLMGFVVAADVFFAVLLANVPVYETSRQRHLMIQEVRRHEPAPEREELKA